MFHSEKLIVGIDVETHALVPPQPKGAWRAGNFGLQTKLDLDTIGPLRLIQLGWAFGDLPANSPQSKARIVKPDGFQVHPDASAKHRITHELAVDEGRPLRDVLQEMLRDVLGAARRGGRVCAHHLEFDATVITNEMRRLGGFEEELVEWDAFVRFGLCTMNPHIGQWIRMQAGVNDRPQAIPIRLADAVTTVVSDGARLLGEHHDAGNDALMHWHLFRELALRAKA